MSFAEDMTVFFKASEFAESASFTPAGGGAAVTANVIFDLKSDDVFGNNVLTNEYQITYQSSDLSGILSGDTGTVNGVSYKIRDIRFQDDGKLKVAKLSKV